MSSKTSFSFEKELTPQQRKLRSWDLANSWWKSSERKLLTFIPSGLM
jgi:hypothetical protein